MEIGNGHGNKFDSFNDIQKTKNFSYDIKYTRKPEIFRPDNKGKSLAYKMGIRRTYSKNAHTKRASFNFEFLSFCKFGEAFFERAKDATFFPPSSAGRNFR